MAVASTETGAIAKPRLEDTIATGTRANEVLIPQLFKGVLRENSQSYNRNLV